MENVICSCCNKTTEEHRSIMCSLCKKSYSISCVDITRTEATKIKQDKSGLKWNCKNCAILSDDINSLKLIIFSLTRLNASYLYVCCSYYIKLKRNIFDIFFVKFFVLYEYILHI